MPSYRVPFSSQYADLGHHEWRARGCGITALKMVMDYWHDRDSSNTTVPLDELLAMGMRAGAYIDGIGWSHRGLVEAARGLGYDGHSVDVAPKSPTPKQPSEAWDMLVADLERGPIMASVFSGFDPHRGGGHIIVVTGVADGLVSLNDPEEMLAREGMKNMARESFMTAFKQRYIVIYPR